MNSLQHPEFSSLLLQWFDRHGRKDLPWQINKTPYRVWVSEIMLQQTQVATVIPFFNRFMQAFPTLDTLALAPLDEVLHLWAGLGYYARARNLHKAAQQVMQLHNGELPADQALLNNLCGIGRSTAAAIASIAYGQRAAILDGNVKRVLSRVFAIEGWPGKTEIERQLWHLAETLAPEQRCADYTQAIMDIGATCCTRTKPDCAGCPLACICKARMQNAQTLFPTPKPTRPLPQKHAWFFHIEAEDGWILLQKRPEKGIWGGLWSLPQLAHPGSRQTSTKTQTEADLTELKQHARFLSRIDEPANRVTLAPTFRHTFSHYHLHIYPVLVRFSQRPEANTSNDDLYWHNISQLSTLAVPAPVKAYFSTYAAGAGLGSPISGA